MTGESETSTGSAHAFLYTNSQMLDLNNLIDPALRITLSSGESINDSADIVASGGPGSGTFLLTPTPVPEPDTWALIAAGRSAGGDVPPTRLLQGVVERARGAGATRLVAARAGAHAPERGELLRYGFVDECGELTLEL